MSERGIINFNEDMTEMECLEYNGIRICWNSGRKRWRYDVNESRSDVEKYFHHGDMPIRR